MKNQKPTRVDVLGDGHAVLYCGDCLEILPTLAAESVVVTDPPFNIGFSYDTYRDALSDPDYQEPLRRACPVPAVIVHYPEDMFVVSMALGELPEKCVAWIYNANTARQWRMVCWFGCEPDFSRIKQPYKNPSDKRIQALIRQGSNGRSLYDWWEIQQVRNVLKEKTAHPCQMPLEVMRRIIAITPGDTILDPFMGSGTTGVAAIQLGRKFMGIEIDPHYFAIAHKRILDAAPLFTQPVVKPPSLGTLNLEL